MRVNFWQWCTFEHEQSNFHPNNLFVTSKNGTTNSRIQVMYSNELFPTSNTSTVCPLKTSPMPNSSLYSSCQQIARFKGPSKQVTTRNYIDYLTLKITVLLIRRKKSHVTDLVTRLKSKGVMWWGVHSCKCQG